jgi:hypothetical protein
VRPTLEQELGMAATADGGIEQPTRRDVREQRDDLVGHHRTVVERGCHRGDPGHC